MIADYTKKFTKSDIHLFQKNSIFLIHIHEGTAYFNLDFQDYNGKEKLPDNFRELAHELEKLGVIGELRYSNKLEDGYFAIENYNEKKIEVLFKVLFEQHNRENPEKLDKITNIYFNKGYRVDTIVKELGITDNKILFNDIEICIHAISTAYPERIFPKVKEVTKKSNIVVIESKKYEAKYYKDGNFSIGKVKSNIRDLSGNDRNGIAFFFTIIEKGLNKRIVDYKGAFEENKMTYFQYKRKSSLKLETFKKDHPNRFNKFAIKKDIPLIIINDPESGISIEFSSKIASV